MAILQQNHLSLWDANEDYFYAIEQPKHGCLYFLPDFKGRCNICLFSQESDGNFHVFFDRTNLLVLSEISADEGYEINHRLPPITQAILEKPSKTLHAFGGKVVVFDATIPGHAIDLQQVGCGQAQFGTRSMSYLHDAALVEIDTGDWQVFELFLDTEHLSFSGVWFQRT